jgi:hypothetical protein
VIYGIGGTFGYWMVWDEKAKLVASLARLIESLPIFGLPELNFVRLENLTTSSSYSALHPLQLHILPLHPDTHTHNEGDQVRHKPPKTMAYGLLIMLFVLS